MPVFEVMFRVPQDLELWIVLVYVAAIVIGARIIEALARMHLARARRNAEEGFEYLADEDRYHCAGGERLALHALEPARQLAVYRALPHQCETCHLKDVCAPHGEGRRIYRSLAIWAETDVGRFHQRISLLMFAAGSLVSAAGIWKWSGRPGTGYLLLGLAASSSCTTWDLWSTRHTRWGRGLPEAAGSVAEIDLRESRITDETRRQKATFAIPEQLTDLPGLPPD